MMDENINESAEIQEVAEPETEALESAETQEVAEPVEADDSNETVTEDAGSSPSGKTEADARFAEMRRENERLMREAELMRGALSRYFDGETAEELSDNANAYAEERDPEEYRQERIEREETEQLKRKNEELQDKIFNMEIDRLMQEGLREIQEINPNIKSLEELGESFAHFIGAGLSSKEAYYATLTLEGKEKVQAPDPIGRVSDNRAERDYFTSEEIDNLTEEELMDDETYAKVMKSMERLYGK